MSILIIGDDPGFKISRLYRSCGAYKTECWGNCECLASLPEGIDGVVFLQDECNHCLIGSYKKQAAEKGIPCVSVRNPKRARSEFIKLSGIMEQQWIAQMME